MGGDIKKDGASPETLFSPDPDQKSAYAFVTSSSVLQVTLECGKLVASILDIHECAVSKRMLYMPNNMEGKANLAQNDCQKNRQTKWTWASHGYVLITYCCEGNSHDAMFRCCGGALDL